MKRRQTTVPSSPNLGDASFRSLWLRQSGGRSVLHLTLQKQWFKELVVPRRRAFECHISNFLGGSKAYYWCVSKTKRTAAVSIFIVLLFSLSTPTSSAFFGESKCSKLSKKLNQQKYQKAIKTSPDRKSREDWMYTITYAVAQVNYPSCFTSESLKGAKSFLKQVSTACKLDRQFSSACIYSPFGKQVFPIDWL